MSLSFSNKRHLADQDEGKQLKKSKHSDEVDIKTQKLVLTITPPPTIKQQHVAIIGTAGRDPATHLIDCRMYEKMCEVAWQQLKSWFSTSEELKQVILVSGGSAISDQVAVQLFNDHSTELLGLHLFLPCQWLPSKKAFSTVGFCGKELNRLHLAFSKETKIDPFEQLHMAISSPRCKVTIVQGGFLKRNAKVAEVSKYMIAFSWEGQDKPTTARSGTTHTWKLCRSKHKRHFNLNQFQYNKVLKCWT